MRKGGGRKNFGRCRIKWAQKILGLGTEQEKKGPPPPQKLLRGKPLRNLSPPESHFLLTFKLTLAMQPTPLLPSTTHDTWHGCYTFLLQGQKNRRGETPFPLFPCAPPPRYFRRYQQRAREKEEEREREAVPPSLSLQMRLGGGKGREKVWNSFPIFPPSSSPSPSLFSNFPLPLPASEGR